MKRLVIIGAAELGRLIGHHARSGNEYDVIGYYDDLPKGVHVNNLPILGTTDRIEQDFAAGRFDALMIGIGYRHMASRATVFERFMGTIPFANIIHSSCYVDASCTLGEGIVILPGVVVDMEVHVEDNVLLNTGVTIAHHSRIEKHSFLAPAVHVAGFVTIGVGSFVGIGATIVDCISIAPWSVVGAGAVVIRDTEPYSVSVGAPSHITRYTNS